MENVRFSGPTHWLGPVPKGPVEGDTWVRWRLGIITRFDAWVDTGEVARACGMSHERILQALKRLRDQGLALGSRVHGNAPYLWQFLPTKAELQAKLAE